MAPHCTILHLNCENFRPLESHVHTLSAESSETRFPIFHWGCCNKRTMSTRGATNTHELRKHYNQYNMCIAQYLVRRSARRRQSTDWWWWWCLSTVSSNVDEPACASPCVTSSFFQMKMLQMTSLAQHYTSSPALKHLSRSHYPTWAGFCMAVDWRGGAGCQWQVDRIESKSPTRQSAGNPAGAPADGRRPVERRPPAGADVTQGSPRAARDDRVTTV